MIKYKSLGILISISLTSCQVHLCQFKMTTTFFNNLRILKVRFYEDYHIHKESNSTWEIIEVALFVCLY